MVSRKQLIHKTQLSKTKKQTLKVTIDRPIGYTDKFGNVYPLNYGFVKGIMGGDGEEQDVYILSREISGPIETFEGDLIAVITRHDDVEDKWVVAPPNEDFSVEEIREKVHFIEQYFDSEIELI
ncbi:inorganic pyrophosphatase [Listeria marthii]|uniref:inorganic diphosphatase n=1 Tax=Listeria marthii TaxID=529731 RepID=UPI0016268970|nr:inorganic diphosphatase [Listeria marthii]MBC1999069.1 inorganic pyrophosphatase [Listeria marthii]MBC2074277.1 inorganic pyrophosphatase [Listeria marthii]MBC2076934.1 inorganic pyrophosphatase [Listeria marthii]MBF2392761.1 inorganic pyrophosphatase [Listeria marthii]MBF2477846.1 inorganic pyrophosphatase [Listeria marthii]